jgi:ABC-2 type transport system ATP-binding protein
MTTAAISVQGLSERFGDRVAVDGLTLDVPRGVVAGFIGPNGAGKTTTMAMLLGLVAPTAGTGTVLGQPLEHRPVTWAEWARSSRGRPCGPG